MERLQVIAADRDLTGAYSGLTMSNTDPGGFEALTVQPSGAAGIEPGDTITVRCGLDVAWQGRVNEPGQRDRDQRTRPTIAAVGQGAKLTDGRMSEIYVDRDLGKWRGPSRARQIDLAATYGFHSHEASPDPSGTPALLTRITGAWSGRQPICQAVYDAGSGLTVAAVYYDYQAGGSLSLSDTNWVLQLVSANDDQHAGNENVSVRTGPNPSYYTPATPRRTMTIQHLYAVQPGGVDGNNYDVHWRLPAVYGNHGLTKRGTDPGGFYPSDIAGHAHTQSGAAFDTQVTVSSDFILPHAVYREPVPHERVIGDMAKLLGWHWGVWEPRSVLSDTPVFLFAPPPTDATCFIARSDCSDLDAPKVRLDRLYDTAKVTYQDGGGSSGVATVTLANPHLAEAGITGRVLDLQLGQGTQAAAEAFGAQALKLALASARGGGSATLPLTVGLPGGGGKPACLLKAGRDRIRITDLPDSGPLTATGSDRLDTFLVRRVETTVTNGLPRTRVEFDGGADLLEVLQARLAVAQAVAG